MLQSSIHSSSLSSSFRNPPLMENHQSNSTGFFEDEARVLAPLPVRREALYGDDAIQQEDEETVLALAASMEALMTNDASTSTEMDEDSSMMYESSSHETCLMEEKRRMTYPALPEEPKTADRNLVCRVGFWLPQEGRRVQRSFLCTDPIQLLWSFISSQFDELENNRPFRLTVPQGILGTVSISIVLDYECKLSFDESGLSNLMILVTWDD